jgi:hypothetical protein
MTPRAIDRFFRTLTQEFGEPATIIVTGAAAGSLWGHIRPSQDIDFGVQMGKVPPRPGRDKGGSTAWERFDAAVNRTVQRTGIQANYAEDLDRWSPITLLDYRRHTAPYRRFGKLSVRLLDPVHWSIGKMGRYFDFDVDDVVAVLRHTRVSAASAIRVWARASQASPRSTAVTQFRSRVEHFLRTYGQLIWGRGFDAEAALRRFQKAADIRVRRRPSGRVL